MCGDTEDEISLVCSLGFFLRKVSGDIVMELLLVVTDLQRWVLGQSLSYLLKQSECEKPSVFIPGL